MRYGRLIIGGLGVVAAAAVGLAVRGADAGEARPATITVYKSPT